ncbi:chemotaxis protein W [Alishewanella longhuensis]|uniref:Chemotaxis protein W n=1 Tax=Alishewanella longhuensis TaxID=1091037 RepID=A0ABQ3KY89_9ALTE|nr:chemotaxis protein CheW [Alishewanella longhuensis]GHG69614.1 chemotaxis protein W [Alishewanella longhuensis]
MSHLIASQKVIQHYLKALLTEEDAVETPVKPALADEKKAELNKLLAQAVPVATKPAIATPVVTQTAKPVVASPTPPMTKLVQLAAKSTVDTNSPNLLQRDIPVAQRLAAPAPVKAPVEKAYRNSRFQALFFSVAGLKVAVPLTELGGIHELTDINTLFGKPSWFKGVMLYREQKLNVVDTARWIMPEKYDATLAQGLNYQYLVMLGSSNWGLCCETLIDTITLEPEQIKWREHEGKRPWMAGLIKEHMCVLVDVEELITLLGRGLDINA